MSAHTHPPIFIGADHGGFEYKKQLSEYLQSLGYAVTDCGAYTLEQLDDYPQFAIEVAKQVAVQENALGILLCRTGAGMCIAANKQAKIRAVCTVTPETTRLAREHNHANVLALGADEVSLETARELVRTFLESVPSSEQRHVRRVSQLE